MIDDLRRRIEGEEFDYQTLLDSLKQYERPRDKITSLLRQGAIIRVKKGIYVFGPKYAQRPFSRETLAKGELDAARYESYLKQRRELRQLVLPILQLAG